MILMDGKKVSQLKSETLKKEIQQLKEIYNKSPKLAIILIGDDKASEIYVNAKIKKASSIGIDTLLIKYETIKQKDLEKIINDLNYDNKIDGIIVQLPLPKNIDQPKILDLISYKKDVDGFSVVNQGKLMQKRNTIISATPKGIIDLIDFYNIDLEGKNAVVIGRSLIVGLPIFNLLLSKNMTVTICHRHTKNLIDHTKNADLLVVATGNKHLITEDMVKENSVIIDVGINRIDNKIYGDVDFLNVSKKVAYITPVPGGIGPMTIIALLENLVQVFKENIKKKPK